MSAMSSSEQTVVQPGDGLYRAAAGFEFPVENITITQDEQRRLHGWCDIEPEVFGPVEPGLRSSVDFGGIEERDALFHGVVQKPVRGVLVYLSPKSDAPQPDCADLIP